jgi:hypothetical protein
MVQKFTLTACLIGSCVLCLALVLRVEAAQPAEAMFKPVAPVESLMYGQATLFTRMGTLMTQTGNAKMVHELEEASYALAELANVNRHNNENEDYKKWATLLRDTCLQLAKEAEKAGNADAGRLKLLFDQAKGACQSCHDVYQQ